MKLEVQWLYAKYPSKPGLYLRTTAQGYSPVIVSKQGNKFYQGRYCTPLNEISPDVSWLGPLPEADTKAWVALKSEEPELAQGRRNQRLALIAGALEDFVKFVEADGIALRSLLEKFCALRKLDLSKAQPKWFVHANTRYKLRKQSEGKCNICGKPAVNKQHCDYHREQQRAYQVKKRARAKAIKAEARV